VSALSDPQRWNCGTVTRRRFVLGLASAACTAAVPPAIPSTGELITQRLMLEPRVELNAYTKLTRRAA
jgi:hypothetical protein